MDTHMEGWVASAVGPHSVVGHRAKGRQMVVEVVDAAGDRWFAKRVELGRHWQNEVRAYRSWTSAIEGQAPTLLAANAKLLTLLLSAVPGEQAKPLDPASHREAGRVLRGLHEARPERTGGPHLWERASRRLEAVFARDPELFSAAEMRFAREQTREMASLQPRSRVPCHGDYKPHNWIVDEEGRLRVIDFAEARWHCPAFDFTRLYFGRWWKHPHLAAAFFEGYGRKLDEDERRFLRLHMVSNAVITTWYGHAHQSSRQESFGRQRLCDLMAGHVPC